MRGRLLGDSRGRVGQQGDARVFALEIVSTQFAFVVLEGPERLVEWGGHGITSDESLFLTRLAREVERYRPDVLVIEDAALTRKGQRVRTHLVWAEQWASDHGYGWSSVSRERLAAYQASYGATKQERARALSEIFPELAPLVPRPRKVWEAEPKRLSTFVALLRGLYWYYEDSGVNRDEA